ncbi:MAG: M23 family metallopeptidase [Bacteroides sp.]|nr:M23 family metallopeptidase [Bacteroides sp.]MCM1389720.1 M23 family metallopeptidase [Bacteroides sp.]
MFIAITSMVSMLILLTPVRTLLPGYLKESQRQQVIASSIRVDSLLTHTELNSSYIANLQRILNMPGDTIDLATSIVADSIQEIDSLLPASVAEKQFVRRFEEQEKFNLKVLSPIAAEGLDFFPPVAGAYTTSPREQQAISVTLICAPKTPVTSVLSGTVIDCHKIFGRGYTVIIQHPNGFISKYSGIASSLVNTGEKVEPGTPIGLSGDNSAEKDTQVIFELWHKGTPLNPWDYIPFF